MSPKFLLHLFLGVVLFSSLLSVTHSQDDEGGDEDAPPRSCSKYIIDFVLGLVQSSQKCLTGQATFHLKDIFELPSRIGCLLRCSLTLQGIIGEDGHLDDIGAAFFFQETFPEEVREISLPEAQACFALAEGFNPKDYWCSTYLPFIECSFRAILKGLIPYGGQCISNPIIGILFSVLKYISPTMPKVEGDMEELRRSVQQHKREYTCMDKECNKRYAYKTINGTENMVIYDKNMTVISMKPKSVLKKGNKSKTSTSQ